MCVLDEKDLQILQKMFEQSEARMGERIDTAIAESEARMGERIDTAIAASEARMTAKIAKVEEHVEENRSTIMAYLETAIEPKLRLLAEGHQALAKGKADNERVDKLEEKLATTKSLVMVLGEDVSKLKKAQ